MPAGVNFFLARRTVRRHGPPAAAASGVGCIHARLRLPGCGEGKRERRGRGEALEGLLRGRGGRLGEAGRGMGWGEGLAQAVLALPRRRHSPPAVGKKARLAFGKGPCGIVENQGLAWSQEAWACALPAGDALDSAGRLYDTGGEKWETL